MHGAWQGLGKPFLYGRAQILVRLAWTSPNGSANLETERPNHVIRSSTRVSNLTLHSALLSMQTEK